MSLYHTNGTFVPTYYRDVHDNKIEFGSHVAAVVNDKPFVGKVVSVNNNKSVDVRGYHYEHHGYVIYNCRIDDVIKIQLL